LRKAAAYTISDVATIMADPEMIKHRRKIDACVYNAKVMAQLVNQHGSFAQYVASFEAMNSFENLLLLKEELQAHFRFLGGVTVYHFLKDIGMPVLKPDRVICRIFQRLGLIEHKGQLLKTVIQGKKFADATGWPIRYIDIVFVAYGQAANTEFGMNRGICLKEPRCEHCGVTQHCLWYLSNQEKLSVRPSLRTAERENQIE
jgi:DNA-3-methyladenine glycosylase I